MTDITDIGQNPDTSWIFHDFPCFERYKPLQTFSTSTALRMRRSVRFLGHYSVHNIRKTTKIKQKSDRKTIQNPENQALPVPQPPRVLPWMTTNSPLPPARHLNEIDVQAAINTNSRSMAFRLRRSAWVSDGLWNPIFPGGAPSPCRAGSSNEIRV